MELYLLRVYEWKDEANYVTTKMLFVLFYNKVKRKLFIEGLTSSMLIYKTVNIEIEMN